MTDAVTLDIADGVARVTLNRPASGNAIDFDIADGLLDAAIRCGEDPAVRAVLLSGAGKTFCVGGDLAGFVAEGDGLPAYVQRLTVPLHAAVSRFARGSAPVVAAVQGAAAGAGFSLVCGADIVVAAESARFTPAYTRVGVSPDGGMTYFLPRLVGWRKAVELVMRSPLLSAQQAADLGIVTEVVPDGELDAAAAALTAELAAGPTAAFGTVKRLFHDTLAAGLETQLEDEAQAIAAGMRSSDAWEGMRAFLAKRPARFEGR